ncbi:membrane fusion protein, adhesin transport system [Shimia gijangensis]|uniref:Membrane fusion protein, adhesin transport system n=1 Tax=Shimia gijangensis TaxID=1470563 RepID=A0A1M6LVQ2_9RHOB|nr:HlyD family efflux transporter periplasmic adaptor subunit [Shimia gijangensis]SHJ75261.1 membrane fusion protein, adhesin transport system [Shimia gijangensis]
MASVETGFAEATLLPGRIIRVVGLVVLAFLCWAAVAWVDEIVRADGEIVSSSRAQIIQNLEGGILKELQVQQGDTVQAGQVLATLQDTRFRTAVGDLQDQIDALEIKRYRLEAELEGAHEFLVPDELMQRSPHILASENVLLSARQTDFASRREGAREIMQQAAEELSMMETMYKQQIVALIEVNRTRKAFNDAEIRYNEIGTQSELQRAEEYSQTLQDLASRRREQRLAADQLSRTIIRAPMKGIVNSLAVTTIGGVARPGEEIFEIIPLGEELFVEARVKPENIASVVPGQAASIKLTTYDYTIFGTLKGKVDFISADTFEDERRANSEPYYRVSVRVDTDAFTDRQRNIEIRPGMRAQVELQIGSKSILKYLLKPLYKSRDAFREP